MDNVSQAIVTKITSEDNKYNQTEDFDCVITDHSCGNMNVTFLLNGWRHPTMLAKVTWIRGRTDNSKLRAMAENTEQ